MTKESQIVKPSDFTGNTNNHPGEFVSCSKGEKIRLCILFGGRSAEHDISLVSAISVMEALLDHDDFEITAMGITREGKTATQEELRAMLPGGLFDRVRSITAIGSEMSDLVCFPQDSMKTLTAGIVELGNAPEIIFPLLHGTYGEDGTMQGLLEIADIPYIGCGVLASAVAMDKDIVKKLWAGEGLPVTPWITALARDAAMNPEEIRLMAEKTFGYPMFSKPANLGSSVGVRKIHNKTEFDDALRDSARYDRKILIEKGIDAREIECAILGNDAPVASVIGEVLPDGEFYDYDAKYVRKGSRIKIPADIDIEKTEEIRVLAVRAFQTIDGAGLARVDFFLENGTGKIWINEINTMPGFTPVSMYSRLWAAGGVPFSELARRLVSLGKERFEEKSVRKTNR